MFVSLFGLEGATVSGTGTTDVSPGRLQIAILEILASCQSSQCSCGCLSSNRTVARSLSSLILGFGPRYETLSIASPNSTHAGLGRIFRSVLVALRILQDHQNGAPEWQCEGRMGRFAGPLHAIPWTGRNNAAADTGGANRSGGPAGLAAGQPVSVDQAGAVGLGSALPRVLFNPALVHRGGGNRIYRGFFLPAAVALIVAAIIASATRPIRATMSGP